MSGEPLEPVRQCAECGVEWLPGQNWGWKAYWTDNEPPEVAVFCPECVARATEGD